MAKIAQSQNLPADVMHLIEQLERHCLAPDGSYVSKSSFAELQRVIASALQLNREKYILFHLIIHSLFFFLVYCLIWW